MSLTITQAISKHPTSKNNREVFTRVLFLENEVRLLCLVYELDKNGVRLESSAKLKTHTTVGAYVDATGKKKEKNDSGAIKKEDWYKNKMPSGNKSLLNQLFDMFKAEVAELDKDGYFNV